MKRIFTLLITIIMMLSLVIVVNATDVPTATFSADKVEIGVGDEVVVTLSLSGLEGKYGVVYFDSPSFDDKYLELKKTELRAGAMLSDLPTAENGYSGVYAAASDTDLNGVLATFTFEAKNVTSAQSVSFKSVEVASVNATDDTKVKMEIVPVSVKVLGKDFTDLSLTGTGETTYDGKAHEVTVANLPDGATVAWFLKDANGDYQEWNETDGVYSFKNAGTYEFKAVVSKAGYNDKELTGTLTIKPKDVTIDDITITKTYDGTKDVDTEDVTVKANNIQGNDNVSFQLNSITLDSAHAGTYTITNASIKAQGDAKVLANYNLPTTAKVTVKVEKAPLTIKADDKTKLVTTTTDPDLTYQITKGELYNGDELTGSLKRVAGNTAGTYDIEQGDLGNPNYEITFEKGTFTIIEKNYTKLEIDTKPKTDYIEDQSFNPAGMTLKAYYMDANNEEQYDLITEGYECLPKTFEDSGDQQVTVKYGNVETKLDVKVEAKQLTGLYVENNKSTYIQDEEFVANITVYPVYNNDVAPTDYDPLAADKYTVETPSLETVAKEVEVTVKYNGDASITGTYEINIDPMIPESMTVKTDPKTVEYIAGQKFIPEGAVFAVTYNNKKTYDVVWGTNGLSYDKIDKLTTGDTKVTFTYAYVDASYGVDKKVTATVDITVVAKVVESIQVTKYEDKYIEGQSFDKSSVKLIVTYNDKEVVADFEPGNALTVSKDPLTVDTYTITLTYGGKSDEVEVTVAEKKLIGISVDAEQSKTSYVDGDTFDTAKVIVYAYYDNFPEKPVKISETVTSNVKDVKLEDAEKGKITVTITYEGETADLTITVDPCRAIITTKTGTSTNVTRFANVADALNSAKEGDTVTIVSSDATLDKDVNVTETITVEIGEGASLTGSGKITVSSGNLNIVNNSEADIDLSINGETVTVKNDGETATFEPVEDDNFDAYYSFYLQMLQWRNRLYTVSYKQSEGGTVSGATSVRFNRPVTFTITPDEGYEIADVLVNGKSVGAVDSYTIKNLKTSTTVSAVFNKIAAVEVVPETWVNPFVDIAETDAFYAAVQYVYENDLFKGMSTTEFAPETTMTRAMFVTVLGRLTGVNMDDYTTVTFADCEAGSWYAPYVEWAAKSGIVKGMSETEFAPTAEITVEQAVTILYRYMTVMGYDLTGADPLTAYADAESVNDWALSAMQCAVANGIYNVTDTLAPQTGAARSLVATMLYNLSKLSVK